MSSNKLHNERREFSQVEQIFHQRFGTTDYEIALQIPKSRDLVEITVEDLDSASRWSGSFSDKYIENLTKRTGNYKNFETFLKMLINSLEKKNSSVTTRLLSFSDLKAMTKESENESFCGENNEKRYLILVYTAEFDRIQYPLPLSFIGKPNVVDQQNLIRELKAEIKTLKNTCIKSSNQTTEELLQICENLRRERDSLREEVEVYKRQRTGQGNSLSCEERLKDQIIYLQRELTNHKNKDRRAEVVDRTKHTRLTDELQRLRTSENSLKIKMRTLINELAFYRKPQRERLPHTSSIKNRPNVNQKNPPKALSDSETNNFNVYGRSCGRPSSPCVRSSRRFNPTAYVDEKRKREELSKKLRSERIRQKISSRNSSVDSGRLNYPTRPSSVASSITSDDEFGTLPSKKNQNKSTKNKILSDGWDRQNIAPKYINKKSKKKCESDSSWEYDSVTTSVREKETAQLEDVDAKLKRLQEMMKFAFT